MSDKLLHYVDRVGVLGKLERTPQGGYRVPATVARTGVMMYSADACRRQGLEVPDDIGPWVRIHLPAEVLQAAADTLQDAPVTNEHPPEFVNPSNFKMYSAGLVSSGSVTFDGSHLKAKLVIQDSDLLGDIELGARRQVSLGYLAGTRFEPGVNDAGEPYDAVRTKLFYNHAAVVTEARAGEVACLALDSSEIPGERVSDVKIKINGVELEGEAAQAAVDGLKLQLDAANASVVKLTADLETAQSDATFQVKLKAHQDAAEARQAKAEKLGKVKEAYPQLAASLDSASDDFVNGLFVAIATNDSALRALKGEEAPVETPAPIADSVPAKRPSARAAMLAANRKYPQSGKVS